MSRRNHFGFGTTRRGVGGLGQDMFDWSYAPAGDVVSSGDLYVAGDMSTAAVPGAVVPTTQSANWWSTYLQPAVKAVTDLGTGILAYRTQSDINEINLERARRGQQPLSPAYMQAMAPQVNVGLAPQTKQLLIYGGLALLAGVVLMRAK
jgi:hypothetical protein